jgi:hypothetical protein
MNVYLCGPVSGRPRAEAIAHFKNVELEIRRRAKDTNLLICIGNPMRICRGGLDWHVAMRVCGGELARCDGIALLQGWKQSKGAMLEFRLARELHIPVVYIEVSDDFDYLQQIFDAVPEALLYYNARLWQSLAEWVEQPLAEERAEAELLHRYLDPHGFEYINASREE